MAKLVLLLCAISFIVAIEAQTTCPPKDSAVPVFFEDPNDCASFYECSNGEAVHLTCAPQTYFDGTKGYCAWWEKVNCGERATTPVADTTPAIQQ